METRRPIHPNEIMSSQVSIHPRPRMKQEKVDSNRLSEIYNPSSSIKQEKAESNRTSKVYNHTRPRMKPEEAIPNETMSSEVDKKATPIKQEDLESSRFDPNEIVTFAVDNYTIPIKQEEAEIDHFVPNEIVSSNLDDQPARKRSRTELQTGENERTRQENNRQDEKRPFQYKIRQGRMTQSNNTMISKNTIKPKKKPYKIRAGSPAENILIETGLLGQVFQGKPPPRNMVARFAGYRNEKQPGFQTQLYRLRREGYVEFPYDRSTMKLTELGKDFVSPHVGKDPVDTAEFHDCIKDYLSKKQKQAFDLLSDGRTLSRADFAIKLGYPNAYTPGFKSLLSGVKRDAFLEYIGKDSVRLSDRAFPFGRPCTNKALKIEPE